MGMFDDITYKAPCPMCGTLLTGWQSKDAGCGLQKLTPEELWKQRRDRTSAEIELYQNCGKCGTWVEIHLGDGHVDWTDDDFKQGAANNLRMPPRKRGPAFPVSRVEVGTNVFTDCLVEADAVPVVWLDPEDDDDPYYSWQEEMTHRAAAERITYGEWIRRELGRLLRYDRANLRIDPPGYPD